MLKRKRTLRIERLEDRQMMAILYMAHLGDQGATAEAVLRGEVERPAIPVVQELVLNSLPGAPATLFLDFNGHFQEERFGDAGLFGLEFGGWENILTPAFDRDGDPLTFSAVEQQYIQSIWRSVAEDYAPFNINVTTIDPDPGNFHPERPYLRVVISGDDDFTGNGLDGVTEKDLDGSYDSYADDGDPNVSYVFNKDSGGSQNSIRFLAEAVSHEAGHAFGLEHQDSVGNRQRGPIMRHSGSPDAERATWSYRPSVTIHVPGTFPTVSFTYPGQDDMATIASDDNGFGYRPDDHAASFGAASPMGTDSRPGLHASGVIENNSDVDTFRFDTSGGNISITLTLPQYPWGENAGNLDATLRLYNSNGTLIAEDSDPSLLAGLTANLTAGTYYVRVGSYGAYGDVGQYSFSVTEMSGARIVSSVYSSISPTLAAVLVTFNEPINPLSFTIHDVRINGGAAGAGVLSVVSVNGSESRTFLITVNKPAMTTAQWGMSIGPNIADLFGNNMDQNSNGINGELTDRYMANFLSDGLGTYDSGFTTNPTKTSTSLLLSSQTADAVFQNYR